MISKIIYFYVAFVLVQSLVAVGGKVQVGTTSIKFTEKTNRRNLNSMHDSKDTTSQQPNSDNKNNHKFIMPTFAECNASYGRRDYLWITEVGTVPPMLLTFPGSGTTMSQLLMEYATGVYSGSIYPEEELYDIMPGTVACGQRLSIIKAHVKDINFKTNPSGEGEHVTFKTNAYVAKCRRGIIYSFDRFILVLRNPWAAIWSNYQRDYNTLLKYTEEELMTTLDSERHGHSGGVPVSAMNYTSWNEKALYSPHYSFSMFNYMWNTTNMKLFHKYNYSQADDVNYGNSSYYHHEAQINERKYLKEYRITHTNNNDKESSIPKKIGTNTLNDNILVVRYEDLLHTERRVHVLRKMVDFTHLGLQRSNHWYTDKNSQEYIEFNNVETNRIKSISKEEEEYRRLQCAFILSDKDEVHRKNGNIGSANDNEVYMKRTDAYKDQELVCKAWKDMQQSADELMRYGYYHGPNGKSPPIC